MWNRDNGWNLKKSRPAKKPDELDRWVDSFSQASVVILGPFWIRTLLFWDLRGGRFGTSKSVFWDPRGVVLAPPEPEWAAKGPLEDPMGGQTGKRCEKVVRLWFAGSLLDPPGHPKSIKNGENGSLV